MANSMRDEWYGDKRDLIKWGVLLELERRYKTQHILQVLYYTKSNYAVLEIDGNKIELNSAVLKHFRDVFSVSKIKCNSRIEVVEDLFRDRDAYHQNVIKRIQLRTELPGIVFLDPDTGLEPSGGATPKHVRVAEVAKIWDALTAGDVLVLYQHQIREAEWIQSKKGQFEKALGNGRGKSKMGQAKGIAKNVVLFFAEKDS